MNLNHLLLFIAVISPVILLARTRGRLGPQRSWRLASIAVLLVVALAWVLIPRLAGYIGCGAWFALLVVPLLALRKMSALASQERYGTAHLLARALSFLYPFDEMSRRARLWRALDLTRRERKEEAFSRLARLQSETSAVGREAIAQTFRLRGDWRGLIEWCGQPSASAIWWRDPAILALYLRALGETHSPHAMVFQFAARAQMATAGSPTGEALQSALLPLFAFGGRTAPLVRLIERSSRRRPAPTGAFWIATSHLAAGEIEKGREQLRELLATTTDGTLRADISQRLQNAETYRAPVDARSAETDRILDRVEKQPVATSLGDRYLHITPVVLTLIALNAAMFALEIFFGGSQNPLTLHYLGQLETFSFFQQGQYWRLLSSLFLHYGFLHITFNLYALYILGPALERAMGGARFAACYLLSGIGAGLGVVTLHRFGFIPPQDVVGASGSIMGVVGAWAGLLLKNRHAPLAGRRLRNIAVIIVIQTAFDLSTPQVSMASHLSGLVGGLVLGLILAPRALRT